MIAIVANVRGALVEAGGCRAAKQNAHMCVAALQLCDGVRRTPGSLRSPGAKYVSPLPRLRWLCVRE